MTIIVLFDNEITLHDQNLCALCAVGERDLARDTDEGGGAPHSLDHHQLQQQRHDVQRNKRVWR